MKTLNDRIESWRFNSDKARVSVPLGQLREVQKEVADLKDSQMRLVDALKACKERNGETE